MMKKLFLVALLILSFSFSAHAAAPESTYDRVMRTGTIRCGYITASPYFMKNPNTGKFSGIWYDYTEEMGRQLNLSIQWVEEIGISDVAAALDSRRIDALCFGLWIDPARAKIMDFVKPITYQVVYAYVREDDHRFDHHLDKINSPSIKISCMDGEMAAKIAAMDYPKAQASCLPQLTPYTNIFMNIIQKKADITFASPATVAQFNKDNSPKLHRIETPFPIRTFPESIVVARGDNDFRRMLDHTTEFLINSGKIERILQKYESSKEDFVRLTKPYEVQK